MSQRGKVGHDGRRPYTWNNAKELLNRAADRVDALEKLKQEYGDQMTASNRSEMIRSVFGRIRSNKSSVGLFRQSLGLKMSVSGEPDGAQPSSIFPKSTKPTLKTCLRKRRSADAKQNPSGSRVTFSTSALERKEPKGVNRLLVEKQVWFQRVDSVQPETPEELGFNVFPSQDSFGRSQSNWVTAPGPWQEPTNRPFVGDFLEY